MAKSEADYCQVLLAFSILHLQPHSTSFVTPVAVSCCSIKKQNGVLDRLAMSLTK